MKPEVEVRRWTDQLGSSRKSTVSSRYRNGGSPDTVGGTSRTPVRASATMASSGDIVGASPTPLAEAGLLASGERSLRRSATSTTNVSGRAASAPLAEGVVGTSFGQNSAAPSAVHT